MKNFSILFLLVSFSLVSCGEEVKKEVPKPIVGEIVDIEIPFQNPSFKTNDEKAILEELDICGDPKDSLFTPCTAEFFELTKFRSDKKIKDAFILQIKGSTMLKGENKIFPVRRMMVFERENGKLVKTNGFVGELVAFEQSATAVQNLIVAFYDTEEDVIFHCVFEWKNKRYDFKEVKAIDFGPGPKAVKASEKETVDKEIYQILVDKKVLF